MLRSLFLPQVRVRKNPIPYPNVDTKGPMALWQCFSMHDSCTTSNSLSKGSSGTKSPSQNTDCCNETVKFFPLDTQNKDLPCQLPRLDDSWCMEVLWKAHHIIVPTGNSWSYTALMAMVWSFTELWKHSYKVHLARAARGWRNHCWMSGSLESSSVWCSCLCQILWETETKWYLCFQTFSPNR